MTSALARGYLDHAARCYEWAGLPGEAARCLDLAGESAEAARLYEAAGTAHALTEAARCYVRAGLTADAARCMERMGELRQAAKLWLEAGQVLDAAWAMLRVGGHQPARTRSMLTGARCATPVASLRRDLGLRLLDYATAGTSGEAGRAAERVALLTAQCEPVLARQAGRAEGQEAELARLEDDAVHAASLIARPDLAADLIAASCRAGREGADSRLRAQLAAVSAREDGR